MSSTGVPVLGTAGAATLGIRHSDCPGLKGPLPLFRPSLFPHQKQPFLRIHSGFWLGFLKKILAMPRSWQDLSFLTRD